MDERYRGIYQDLYETALSPEMPLAFLQRWERAPYWEWGGFVRQAVQAAERADPYDRSLRSDARALLGVNFAYLVVTPLVLGGRPLSEFEAEVRADIKLLVSEARSDREEQAEISGHAVVDSLSRNWSKLQIGRFRLWEQEN